MDLEVLQSAVPPPRQLLLQLLLLLVGAAALAWGSNSPVATAVTVGGLGIASFLLVATRPRQNSAPPKQAMPPKEPPVAPKRQPKKPPPLSINGGVGGRRTARPPDRLPLSCQISADYSDVDNSPLKGATSDLPPRLFWVVQHQSSLLELDNWRYAEQKAEEAARVTHFAWTIPRWKGARSVTELESADFKDDLMEGVSWRCMIRRDPATQRLLVLVKAAQLSPAEFPEGRLFAEISCSCEGRRKSTFVAFYPGIYEFVLSLDTNQLGTGPGSLSLDPHQLGSGPPGSLSLDPNQLGSGPGSLTVSCTAAVLSSVRIHQLAETPATCQTDGQGRYVNCHSAGIRWQIADWERFAWEPGWAIFSPLFSSASLPGCLWQLHLFPESDDPSSAGYVSAFLKLVDSTAAGGAVEVDFQLTLQGDEEGGLFDTASFSRGAAHGFRGIRRLEDLRGSALLAECALRVKLPLFT